MEISNEDIEFIIKQLRPKMLVALTQTRIDLREDLEQELSEIIVRKIKEKKIDNNVPSFFEYLNRKREIR